MAKKPQTRQERLAAALRENLKRRKATMRNAARPAPQAVMPEPGPVRPNTAKKGD
jgi:hypothetical protein